MIFSYLKEKKEKIENEIKELKQNKILLEEEIKRLNIKKQENVNNKSKLEKSIDEAKQIYKNLENEIETKSNIDIKLINKIRNEENIIIDNELKYIDTMSGYDFEKYCSNLLKKLRYNAIVTKCSNDFGGDIVAEKNNIKYIIQCKRYHEKISAKPIGEVLRAMSNYNCNKGILLTNNFFTDNAIIEAKNCNVELWDRNILTNKIREALNFSLNNFNREETKRNDNIYHILSYIIKNNKTKIDIGELNNQHFCLSVSAFNEAMHELEEMNFVKKINSQTNFFLYDVLINKENMG